MTEDAMIAEAEQLRAKHAEAERLRAQQRRAVAKAPRRVRPDAEVVCGACGEVLPGSAFPNPAEERPAYVGPRCGPCTDADRPFGSGMIIAAEPYDPATAEPEPQAGHRCGWGGLPRCTVFLPERGLCDGHRAQLRALTNKNPRRRVENEAAERAESAAERRAKIAADAARVVREATALPMRQVDMARALNVSTSTVARVIKDAPDDQVFMTGNIGPRATRGIWPSRQAYDDALAALERPQEREQRTAA
jgi:hypothetical protein